MAVSNLIQPTSRSQFNNLQRVETALRHTLLKVVLDIAHLIGDVRETDNVLRPGLREGIQRCRFHLHGEYSF